MNCKLNEYIIVDNDQLGV